MDVVVLYEDEDILAVNKPAGLMVHGDGRSEAPTLVEWLLEYYPAVAGVGEPLLLANGTVLERPGIVHRIDRETSGVLLVAKNQDTFLHLKEQFQARAVLKTYNAFLYGAPEEREGVIAAPIGKSTRDFRRFAVPPRTRGTVREAETQYRVLEATKAYSFVEARPKTGRTHQLRVHFGSIGHPVVCDRLYAPHRVCASGFDRLALHARSISFLVSDAGRLTIEAGLPTDFERALGRLRAGD